MYTMHAGVVYSVLLCCCVFLVNSETPRFVPSGKGDGMGSIKLKAAQLNEEETHSNHMPSALKCDACNIIAHLLVERFSREHNKMKSEVKKKGRLGEADVLVMFDAVCNQEFDSVGVKDVDGETRLSGPGVDTKDVPGFIQGGGKWPRRLATMCEQYAGEIGEVEIYSVFVQKKNLKDFLCKGTGLQGFCNLPKKKKFKEEL